MDVITTDIADSKNQSDDTRKLPSPTWHTVRSEGTFSPLVLVPPCFGGACYFFDLKDMVEPEQPIYIIEPNIDGAESPSIQSVEDMTLPMADLIEHHLPGTSIRLCGLAWGGNLAWDLSKQLQKRGYVVEFLIMLDSYVLSDSNHRTKTLPNAEPADNKPIAGDTRFHSDRFSALPLVYQNKLGRLRGQIKQPYDANLTEVKEMRQLLKQYEHGRLEIDVYVFCPLNGVAINSSSDPTLGWGNRVGGDLRIIPAHGNQKNFLDKPMGINLARSFNSILKQ